MDAKRELAIFLHNEYEKQAKIVGWKTQDSCQVEFDKLPEANKKVMLAVAESILAKLPELGFVRLEDVTINTEELANLLMGRCCGLGGSYDIWLNEANFIASAKGILKVKEGKK